MEPFPVNGMYAGLRKEQRMALLKPAIGRVKGK
jgi:hypothetical protein